jgi:RNA polymerase sigma-70 factor, ECF subfamily
MVLAIESADGQTFPAKCRAFSLRVWPHGLNARAPRGGTRNSGTESELATLWGIMEHPSGQLAGTNHAPQHEAANASLSDAQIVARVCAGETLLFELLMRRHNRQVFRAARAILKRDDEAEDVMQDAYVRAYAHLGSFKGESSFSTWLTRIAVHEALARVRRERRFVWGDPHGAANKALASVACASPEEQVSDAELRVFLDRAIDALPDDFRLAFVLRAVEQMSGAETADVLGIPEQTVKTRLFRARERLQRELLSKLETNPTSAYAFHLVRCDRVVRAVFMRLGEVAPA